MRELLQSIFRFSWSMSLLGFKQFVNMFSPENLRFAQVSTAAGPALAATMTYKSQDAFESQSPVVQSGGSSVSGNPAATRTAQSGRAKVANLSSTGQVNSGWSPMAVSATITGPSQTNNSTPTNSIGRVYTGWSPMPVSAQPPAATPSGTPQLTTSSGVTQVNSGRLKTARFVVLGEGLAAGMGNFTLSSHTQQWS